MSFSNQLQHSDSKRFQQSISRLHSSAFVFSGRAAHCVIYASYYYHHFLAVIVFHYILSHAGSSSLNRVLSLSLLLHALHPLSPFSLCSQRELLLLYNISPSRYIQQESFTLLALRLALEYVFFVCLISTHDCASSEQKQERASGCMVSVRSSAPPANARAAPSIYSANIENT
jgi:hypothetical protein